MLGAIELVLIVVVIGVISSLVFSSPQTRSRVDWGKVFFVFLVIPALLFVALGGTYFLFSVRSQETAHAIEADQKAAVREAQLAEQLEIVLREQENVTSASSDQSASEDNFAPVEEGTLASDFDYGSSYSHDATEMEHQMPTVIGEITTAASQPTILFVGVSILAIIVLACIFALGSKNARLAVALFSFVMIGFGLLSVSFLSVRVVHTEPPHSTAHSLPSAPNLYSKDAADELVTPVGEITVGEDEAEEVKPLKIRESRYDYSGGISVSTKGLNRIPRWAEEAMSEAIIRPDENEIVITSKRYSSIQEAEAELKKISEVMVSDYIVRAYPEMRESRITAEEIKQLGMLEHSCEITWPFQVGEFSDEVYQVAWQLDVTREIQEKLYSAWQQQQLTHRLAIVGGGFGLLTLMFGVGAVVTRGKDQAHG